MDTCDSCEKPLTRCLKCGQDVCTRPYGYCLTGSRCEHMQLEYATKHRFEVVDVGTAIYDREAGRKYGLHMAGIIELVNQLAFELQTIKNKFKED